MSKGIIQYKIHCASDNKWEYWFLPEGDPPPTTCPTNSSHSITQSSTVIIGSSGAEPERSDANILYTIPRPATISYEMCDRDILIKTSVFDARASATLNGVDTDGTISYIATTPGVFANRFSVIHTEGNTGVGYENRSLDAAFTDDTYDLVVTFATDGSGNTITPTAQQVIDMISAKVDPISGFPSIIPYIIPTNVGNGTSQVQATTKTSLTDGASPSTSDIKINPTTFVKSEWEELQQIGVFKDDGNGGYTECVDQSDATLNACLSVWRYNAHHQTTKMPTVIEIRDGLLIVDGSINDSLEHQAYAIVAPQIPVSLGGSIVQFDAYLKNYKGKELGATSSQAKALDPSLTPAAAELRIYVFYPAGASHNHILRLITYRPPGTF